MAARKCVSGIRVVYSNTFSTLAESLAVTKVQPMTDINIPKSWNGALSTIRAEVCQTLVRKYRRSDKRMHCRTLVYLRSVMVLVSRGWADNPCRSIGEAFAVSVFVSYDRLVGRKLIEASGASLLRMAINGKMSICI